MEVERDQFRPAQMCGHRIVSQRGVYVRLKGRKMAIHCDRGGYVTQYGDGALSVMGQKVELPLEKESSYREVVFIWPS
jgi:hypothetical protein